MATFRKRGDSWRAEIVARGRRESKTFGSKAAARQWASEREAELGKGGAPATLKTLRHVLVRYSELVSPKHAGERWEQIRITKILREFDAADVPLRDLSADDLVAWRDGRLKEVSGGTVAREMGLIRTALRHASREWQWLSAQKIADLAGARKPKGAPARRKGVPQEAITALVSALGYDEVQSVTTVRQRVAIAFLLAIETAMRCGELCSITSADMHLDRYFVSLPKSKNGDSREVPLTAEAVRLFKRLPEQVLELMPAQVDANFRKARKSTRWPGVTFHDSRSEGITRLSRKVDMLTLARIVGHRDPRSLMWYYAETAEQIAARL